MRRCYRGCKLVAGAVLVTLVGAPTAPVSAQSQQSGLAANVAAGGSLVLRSIDDGINYSKSDLADLASELRDGCNRTKVAIKPMTLAKAISDVQAQLDQYATAPGADGVPEQQLRQDGG